MLLNEDQIALRDVARRFAREKLKPRYQAREAEPGFDRALMKEIGALGLIGVDLPEEYGGLGLSGVTSGIITEEMAYGDFNISYLQLLGSLMGAIVHRNANPELARHWNTRLVAGEAIIGLGLTEPRGGSDAANLQLKARREGQHFVLSGEKTSITFSDQCDAMILFARTGAADAGARGISAFLVPMDLPGIQRTRFNDLGSKIIGRGSVFFDEVRVPAENLLGGEEGRGFVQLMQELAWERLSCALGAVTNIERAVDMTVAYVKERHAFGKPLMAQQNTQFELAECKSKTVIARTFVDDLMVKLMAGDLDPVTAAMAKWWTTDMLNEVADACLQLHGGYGYMSEYPISQLWADARVTKIFAGANEIMKMLIARAL